MSIYTVNKVLFAEAIDQMLEATIKDREGRVIELRTAIIEVYNITADSNENMMKKIIELRQLEPLKPMTICAKCGERSIRSA